MVDLTPLINALIAVVAVVITAYVIPWVKSQTTEKQREEINAWIKIAVQAAEQTFRGDGRGAEKKQYVLDYLNNKGFKLDISSIDRMVEAAVLELNKGVL